MPLEHEKPSHWNSGRIPEGKADHPVVNVSWRDAIAFCQWASVRLPSEAEWEKAARGTDRRVFPWGDNDPTKESCNFNGNVNDTTPVGRYPKDASPYGVHDMAGNVLEWTNSLNRLYPYDLDDGREDPEKSGSRTVRGGSWRDFAQVVRCAYRGRPSPLIRRYDVGFR